MVYLTHCAQLSGAELALVRLLPALQDAVEAHVILAEDGPLAGELRSSGARVEVMALPESARGLTREQVRLGRLSGASVAQLIRHGVVLAGRLRRLQPDLVHTNSLKAGVYGGWAARLARVPAVWHLRDRVADDYLSPSGVRLVRFFLRTLPTTVIVNSEATLATVAGLGLTADVVGSPVSPWMLDEEVVRGARPQGSGSFRVGMVGRLAPWKGQHVFLDAFARAFPTGGAVAVIVGSAMFGESEYEDRLREQVVRLRLEDRVEMTGFRKDVNDELRRLDVLVHASIVPEPFGQVVVEGMAAGLPVVAARAGGPAEVITDGQDGMLYPMGDATALASVLRHLAADPTARSALGAAARVRAGDYAPEVIAGQVLAVYARAVSRARPRKIG